MCGFEQTKLSGEQAHSSGVLDLLLSQLAEELGPHNNWLVRQLSSGQNLVGTVSGNINDRHLAIGLGILVLETSLLAHHRPQLIQIHHGAVIFVARQVKVAHSVLAKVPRVELVKQNSVVMLTSSISATSRMLAVLSHTTLAGGVASSAFLSVFA